MTAGADAGSFKKKAALWTRPSPVRTTRDSSMMLAMPRPDMRAQAIAKQKRHDIRQEKKQNDGDVHELPFPRQQSSLSKRMRLFQRAMRTSEKHVKRETALRCRDRIAPAENSPAPMSARAARPSGRSIIGIADETMRMPIGARLMERVGEHGFPPDDQIARERQHESFVKEKNDRRQLS
jgi:hypothetical protein